MKRIWRLVIAGVLYALPCFAGIINVVTSLGCPANGTGNAATAINQAINAAGTLDTVYVPSGVYLLQGSIVPINGTKLLLDTAAEMRRGWDGGASWTGALVNPSASALAHDVWLRGGKWSNPGNTYTGRVLNLAGNRWLVEGMNIVSWAKPGAASIAMAVQGDDIEIRHCRAVGSPGEPGQAGIRVTGGRRIYIHDCYMESGDDTYCVFPTENKNNWGAGVNADSIVYERCNGMSTAARFLAAGMTVAHTQPADYNLVTISRVRFINCHGIAASSVSNSPALLVYNANSNPAVKVFDISFYGCYAKPESQNDRIIDGVRITAEGAGIVRNIILDQCTTFAAKSYALTVAGSNVDSVSIVNCLIDGTSGSAEALSIRGAKSVFVEGSTIIAGAQDGVRAEATGVVRLVDNRILDVPSGKAGVRVMCSNSFFEKNTIVEKNGAAGTLGFVEVRGADYNQFRCNDCTSVDEAYPQKAAHSQYLECAVAMRRPESRAYFPVAENTQPVHFTIAGRLVFRCLFHNQKLPAAIVLLNKYNRWSTYVSRVSLRVTD